MDGCQGRHLVGQLFAWAGIMIQVTMGVLSGVGPYLEPGGGDAKFQVLSVGVLKCALATLLTWSMPHANLLMNMMLALIFACEGLSVMLLYAAAWGGVTAEAIERTQLYSFWLLLFPVFLPILQKLYDALFVAFILNCVRKKFDCASATHACVMFVCTLPGFIAKFFGVKTSANGGVASKLGHQTTKHLIRDFKK